MGGRHPEGCVTDPRNTRIEEKSRRQRRLEACFGVGEDSEGTVTL